MNLELKKKILALGEEGSFFIDDQGVKRYTILRPPLSSQDKNIMDLELIQKLPEAYLEILKISNGFTLFNNENLDGFRFLGLDELAIENNFIKGIYQEDWDENVLIFCIVLGDGDYFGFKFSDGKLYSIIDCYHDQIPKNWEDISTNIDEFLNRLIDEGGKKFYLGG